MLNFSGMLILGSKAANSILEQCSIEINNLAATDLLDLNSELYCSRSAGGGTSL